MDRTITATDAARNFSDLVNRTLYRGESTTVTRGGKIVMRILPPEKPPLTGEQIAALWDSMPQVSKEDADAVARDLDEARSLLKMPESAWE